MHEEDASLVNSDDPTTEDLAKPYLANANDDEVDSLHHAALDVNMGHDSVEDNDDRAEKTLNEEERQNETGSIQGNGKPELRVNNDPDEDSEAELERRIDHLYLGHDKKDRTLRHIENKPKIGAAKAKRQKRAKKMAALEAEGKVPPKSSKARRPIDPSAAMQKARGETATAGRRQGKK